MILIPVKNLAQAKQRLADALDQPARTELAQAMLLDVLEAIAPWTDQIKLALVTSDPFALDLAERYDFEVIPDAANSSETDAIEMATQVCVSRGVDFTLVLPADIPLILSSELEAILHAAPKEGSVLVPAADGRGTNAVLRRPAGLFPLRFGDDSFQPHRAAAEATQKPCTVLQLPGVALDIDNSSDLRQLANSPGDTRSQRLARKWGLAVRTQAAAR
jgi:2-phospho-L-lactate guanylyltransferase